MGFRGSYISDFFFQSIGIISYLISITLTISGINIFRNKDLFLIIENIFFSILYCILGTVFFDFFHQRTFELHTNGNGGFVGQYLNQNFFNDLINLQNTVSYYFLLILIISLFLISTNFNPKKIWYFSKKIMNYFKKDLTRSYTDETEIITPLIFFIGL